MKLLTDKQIRMLELLDKQIQSCTKCNLYKNGRVKPYWTVMSEYVAITDPPNEYEIIKNKPFVGEAGKILISTLNEKGLRKEQFAIMNSLNCLSIKNDGTKRKIIAYELSICSIWIRKFINIIQPAKMITFGNYAMGQMGVRSSYGIINKNGNIRKTQYPYPTCIILYSIHPAYCIYNKKDGKELLDYSIDSFSQIYEEI